MQSRLMTHPVITLLVYDFMKQRFHAIHNLLIMDSYLKDSLSPFSLLMSHF